MPQARRWDISNNRNTDTNSLMGISRDMDNNPMDNSRGVLLVKVFWGLAWELQLVAVVWIYCFKEAHWGGLKGQDGAATRNGRDWEAQCTNSTTETKEST